MHKLFIFQRYKYALLVCLLFITQISYAQEVAVIMGAKVNTKAVYLSAREVRQIFFRKDYFTAQGGAWIPVNLSAANPVRIAMTQKVLQKSVTDLERYWSEMYFDGISPPYVLASEEAVVSFVAETPSAISYVLACHVDSRVQVVYRFQVANNPALSCAIK